MCVNISCFFRVFFVFFAYITTWKTKNGPIAFVKHTPCSPESDTSSSIKVASNTKRSSIKVWLWAKSSPQKKCDFGNAVQLHVIKVPHAAKKIDGLTDRGKGWLVRTILLLYSVVLWRFRLSFVASKLTFRRNWITSVGASERSTEIQWSLFMW